MLQFVVVTREYLLSLLDAWQQNKITIIELYQTAEQLYFADTKKVLDWEGEGEDEASVTSEVLEYLESLDVNFIVQEDIDPCKEFLRTPIGHFDKGWEKWVQYTYSINYEERMKQLKGQYPYIS